MTYQEELEKFQRDKVALQVQRNELRPSAVRRKGETTYAIVDKTKTQMLAEEIATIPDVELYNKWAIRVLSDETYNIIARVYILSHTDRFVYSYQALLEEAIKVSQLPPVKRGWFSWFADTPQKRLKKIDADLEALRKSAQKRIVEEISELSKPVEVPELRRKS